MPRNAILANPCFYVRTAALHENAVSTCHDTDPVELTTAKRATHNPNDSHNQTTSTIPESTL